MRLTETAEIMARNMREQGYSPEEIRAKVMQALRADDALKAEIAKNTKEYKEEIAQIIKETIEEAKENGDKLVAEAGTMAWNNDLSMWEQHGADLGKPNGLKQLITAFTMQVGGELKNITKSTGFKNTMLGSTGVLNAYQRALDLAMLKVSTGTYSIDQAIFDCIKQLAGSGLRTVDYESGRSYQLDTAVRMCVRTGCSQLAGKVSIMNMDKMGAKLVYVDAHAGARPEHAKWQGKVFTYKGTPTAKYPDFIESTGYGTVEGLKGVNCSHDFYAYWEGDPVPEYIEPEPVTVDGKEYTYYQATQKQRAMERAIREQKRLLEALENAKEPTADERKKLQDMLTKYYGFSSDVGIRAKEDRLRVLRGTSNLNGYLKE